jgi:hypothetical protein
LFWAYIENGCWSKQIRTPAAAYLTATGAVKQIRLPKENRRIAIGCKANSTHLYEGLSGWETGLI